MSTGLLIPVLLLLGYLCFFGIGMLGTLRALFVRHPKLSQSPGKGSDWGEVVVLIPSHREGEAVADAVQTVLDQDYAGRVRVRVLVADASDSSVEPLRRRFGAKVEVVFCGVSGKREKINRCLREVDARYVAFLDADHRVESSWLRTSVQILERRNVDAVQSRRKPLSLSRLSQLWDSAQNHLGNELRNEASSAAGRTVFFTGTTCVFRSAVFSGRVFPDSITEDTFLSYDLILEGRKIAYNPHASSYEEVAPDLGSYVSRRRRWASGHTQTLWSHLPAALKQPFLAAHGQFYLAGPTVVALLCLLALHLYLQYSIGAQLLVAAASAAGSLGLLWAFGRRHRSFVADFFVGGACLFPQFVAVAALIYRLNGSELYYFLVSFPYARYLLVPQLVLLAIPLVVLSAGALRFRLLRPLQVLELFLSYPLFLFLDVYAVTVGVIDFVLGRRVWAPTARDARFDASAVPAALRTGLRASVAVRQGTWRLAWLLGGAFALVVAHDFAAPENCGEPRSWLGEPLLFRRESAIKLGLTLQQEREGADAIATQVGVQISQVSPAPLSLELWVDGALLDSWKVEETDRAWAHRLQSPLGWAKHRVQVRLRGEGMSCGREKSFSTAFKELRDKRLYVNGEPFLVKGVIPSFSAAQIGLPMGEGLSRIKDVGANTVRVYHEPTPEILAATAAHSLLLIDQPDDSTWGNESMVSASGRTRLAKRFTRLSESLAGEPFSLLHNLGNELELGGGGDQESLVQAIDSLLRGVRAEGTEGFLGYSTFLTYVDYPVDILGVNMLDTGPTYWRDALGLLSSFKRPFYASEFGGFAARFEKTPTFTRLDRMKRQWASLLKAGALGAVFFQSHDNWAQPVVEGVNDPFSADQPDDERGLWDERNRPKPELHQLRRLFSDFEGEVDGQGRVSVRNIRPYRLEKVVVNGRELGDFPPGERKELKPPFVASLEARYSTHRGLSQVSWIELPVATRGPRIEVFARDFVEEERDAKEVRGTLLSGGTIRLQAPLGITRLEVNGVLREVDGRGQATLSFPEVNSLARGVLYRSAEGAWKPFSSNEIGEGPVELRVPLPEGLSESAVLVLSGMGAPRIEIGGEKGWEEVECHPYRECLVALGPESSRRRGRIGIRVDRRSLVYIDPTRNRLGSEITIRMDEPRFFAPSSLVVRSYGVASRTKAE